MNYKKIMIIYKNNCKIIWIFKILFNNKQMLLKSPYKHN